jgi:poly(beta-D-mannuronate) lyase
MPTSRSRHLAASIVVAVVGLAFVAACGGDPDDSGASRTSAAAQSEPGPGGLPADVLDLSSWKLTLPVGSGDDEDEAEEIKQPDLATFSDDRFFTTTGDGSGVVFRAPAGGATTSGSGYPRSELREMDPGGGSEASWSNTSGTHVMTVKQAITKVPPSKAEVVAGQIHDDEDDVVMVRLEKKRLFVEADGDDIGTLDADYDLGTTFTIVMKATSDGIEIRYDTANIDGGKTVRYDKVGQGYYFKAGCYTQSNSSHDDDDALGEVVVYALDVEHS